jgi:hypothetical protein
MSKIGKLGKLGLEQQIVTNGDASASANWAVSEPIAGHSNLSCQVVWSGFDASNSVFKMQVSNDGSNWDDVSGLTETVGSAAGSTTFRDTDFLEKEARLNYTKNSVTTGTVNAYIVVK